MFRIDDATAASSLPTPETAGAEGYFTEGDPVAGLPATNVRGSWLNMIQEELRAVVVAAGMTPSKTNYTQVRDAIAALYAPLSGFSGSAGTAGYQKLPGGLIIQWMSVNVAGGATTTYNFPIAFPNNAYAVVGSRGAPGSNASFNFSPISKSQFTAQNYSAGAENASLIAIGS
ncbi:gp53-like domain-containing protein [Burkholderia arboris]|uniref:gp53-like domain-containing protein n=1 Tax=Burkholderia arboris TaxID=488730 RepID=UPI001CF29E4F|nr:hypothetical protein [Burkholderia arboris]MCA8045466.1 hypothetical protein [Burkholderia arboris]